MFHLIGTTAIQNQWSGVRVKILSQEKNTRTSSRNSNRRVSTLPRESHRTSVCNSSCWWSLPISPHNKATKRVCSGRLLMKLTDLTASFKTVLRSGGIFFVASASPCMLQWTDVACGATAFTRLTTPLCCPSIARAPSVLTPTHLDHSIPLEMMKALRMSKIASAVERVIRGLQNRKSSFISPFFSSYVGKQVWHICNGFI